MNDEAQMSAAEMGNNVLQSNITYIAGDPASGKTKTLIRIFKELVNRTVGNKKLRILVVLTEEVSAAYTFKTHDNASFTYTDGLLLEEFLTTRNAYDVIFLDNVYTIADCWKCGARWLTKQLSSNCVIASGPIRNTIIENCVTEQHISNATYPTIKPMSLREHLQASFESSSDFILYPSLAEDAEKHCISISSGNITHAAADQKIRANYITEKEHLQSLHRNRIACFYCSVGERQEYSVVRSGDHFFMRGYNDDGIQENIMIVSLTTGWTSNLLSLHEISIAERLRIKVYKRAISLEEADKCIGRQNEEKNGSL